MGEEKLFNFKQYYQSNTLCGRWAKVEGTVVGRISDIKKVELNTSMDRRTKWAAPKTSSPELLWWSNHGRQDGWGKWPCGKKQGL